jgi:hypothetical protein
MPRPVPIIVHTDRHVFRLRNLQASSARYGACEICGEHVSEVFIQTRYRPLTEGERARVTGVHEGCTFGHETCLRAIQQKAS